MFIRNTDFAHTGIVDLLHIVESQWLKQVRIACVAVQWLMCFICECGLTLVFLLFCLLYSYRTGHVLHCVNVFGDFQKLYHTVILDSRNISKVESMHF